MSETDGVAGLMEQRGVEIQIAADMPRRVAGQELVAAKGAAAGVIGIADVAVATGIRTKSDVAEAAVALCAARGAGRRAAVRNEVEIQRSDVRPGLQGSGVLALPGGCRRDGVQRR